MCMWIYINVGYIKIKKIDILMGEMRALDRDDEADTTASNSILKSPKKYEVKHFT